MALFLKILASIQKLTQKISRHAVAQEPSPKQKHMKLLGSLLCGADNKDGIAKVALTQLSSSISDFSARSITFLKNPTSPDTLALGPFCARVLLENGCAALVGRLDSFRILYLSEFQNQPDYEHNKRAKSAFSWMGDVIPEEKTGPVLWSPDYDMSKISRALFSGHLEHVYWKPAVEKLLDYVSSYKSETALTDILATDVDKYIPSVKGRSLQLYSTLSKGVHWEFYTTPLVFDESTVTTAIRDTLLMLIQLGLTSHFIPTAYASLSPKDALDIYLSIRKEIP
jgi:hypothetical protein